MEKLTNEEIDTLRAMVGGEARLIQLGELSVDNPQDEIDYLHGIAAKLRSMLD